MRKINIIIPTYNEEKNILPLITNIRKYLPYSKIFIVDDSKEDKISSQIKKSNLKNIYYFLRKNSKGRGSAVIYGLKKSLNKNKSLVFIEMDADFSHRPAELKKNIKLFLDSRSDLLIASRYLDKSKIVNWPLSRLLFSRMSNILAQKVLRINVSDYTNGFRIYSSRAVGLIIKKCGKIGDGFIILSEILLVIHINKLRIKETHSIFINRLRGESSVNITLIIKSLIGLTKLYLTKKEYIVKKKN
jgi:dolichol-phosphate mannosyltransferase